MIYADQSQVRAALAVYGDDLDLPDDLEPLIAAGERAVDGRLGPYPVDPVTGLKLNPTLLGAAQAAALMRATAIACGHLAQLDTEQALGIGDWMPAGFTPLRGTGLEPLIDAALAGFDLIARSGCALPDPEPLLNDVFFF